MWVHTKAAATPALLTLGHVRTGGEIPEETPNGESAKIETGAPRFAQAATPYRASTAQPNVPARLFSPRKLDWQSPAYANSALPKAQPSAPISQRVVAVERAIAARNWLALLEAHAGESIGELVARQRNWLASQADAESQRTGLPVSIGEYLRGETQARGHGGREASHWPALSESEKVAWHERFEAAIHSLRTQAPEEIRLLIADAEEVGGGIAFEPALMEEREAFASQLRDTLRVGIEFVRAVESSPSVAYAVVSHELGGHRQFGPTVAWQLMNRLVKSLPPEEQHIATSGTRHLFTVFGYQETEIYAELRELAYHDMCSRVVDSPYLDVPRKLRELKRSFEPMLARALVATLRDRVRHDPRVIPEARQLLEDSIREVFGDDLLASRSAPATTGVALARHARVNTPRV